MQREDHSRLLGAAIDLATQSVAQRGGPFGALVAQHGSVISTGNNQVTTRLDPTAHAEIMAIRGACSELGRFELSGCTLYTSCEPCPMCFAAAHWARLDAVYFAATRHDAAHAGFDDAALYEAFASARSVFRLERIDVPGARAPFDAWAVSAGRVPY